MRIDKIEIDNFKNIEKLSITFDKGVNLFVGANGSGKTTLLEAINVALGGFFGEQEQKMQRMIELPEVRIIMVDGNPVRTEKTSVEAFSDVIGGNWTRNFNSITKNNDVKNVRIAGIYGSKILKDFFKPENKNIAPLIAYYSTQRLFKDASQSAKQKFDPLAGRRNGYLQCLKDNAIKGALVEWLGNAVTSRATKQIKEIDSVDLVLENVEKAIKKTLASFNDDLRENDIKIYQEAKFDFELFIQLKDNFSLPINYYSDGFRNLIYLIVDLIWRASQLNPWLTLEEIINQQSGCVTIDEIDLHLHPKWQSKAIAILQELLPKVQFFITTHSPTVVANFDNGSLFVIDEGSVVKHNSDYFGKEINFVLRNVLGAYDRHVPTQHKIDHLLQLIDTQPDSKEIRPILDGLVAKLGEDDPDIQKAIALYELSNNQD
jgi:predicted ATP-binding protein involved in virulence